MGLCLSMFVHASPIIQSCRYESGRPITLTIGRYLPGKSQSTPISCSGRTRTIKMAPVEGEVNVYCSFPMGEMNPAPYENNQPGGYQTLTLGQTVEGKFVEALRFGMVDDDRASARARLTTCRGHTTAGSNIMVCTLVRERFMISRSKLTW